MIRSHPANRSAALLTAMYIGLMACAGAPVQEMSDARQAILAARSAGAEERAPQQLALATQLLARAEEALQRRDYRTARQQAALARQRAVEALRVAAPREKPRSDDS